MTSAAAASSHSGEKPKAAIEPSSTAFPAVFRTASFLAFGSYSSAVVAGRLDAADELDRDAEEVLRRRLVEAAAPDEPWQHQLGRLVHAAAGQCEERAHRTFREGDEEGDASGHR